MIAVIGAFDGYHIGHSTLLREAERLADETGNDWGVITFSRENGRVLGRKGVLSLFTDREQSEIEALMHIPEVKKMEFTEEIESMDPTQFMEHVERVFGVNGIVVGADFRFGKDRAGDATFVLDYCARRGWSAKVLPVLMDSESQVEISSTEIRRALMNGDMGRARRLLGYPYFMISSVVHGNERGRDIGFPTANLSIPHDKTKIRQGVYAAAVHADGCWRRGAVNVGSNPTFKDVSSLRFEVNIFDYSGDLYEKEIAVFLLRYIREEKRFASAEALAAQIQMDRASAASACAEEMASGEDVWRELDELLSASLGRTCQHDQKQRE